MMQIQITKTCLFFIDDVKKRESTGYAKQAEMTTWTTKTFLLSSLALTDAEKAKNTLPLHLAFQPIKEIIMSTMWKLTAAEM